MKKLIASITLLFFLLGPFGIRPAQAVVPLALMNPATLGLCIAATGVIAAGTAYYAPAVYQAGQMAVSAATDSINRQAWATKTIAVGVGLAAKQYIYGKQAQISAGLDALQQWVYANPSDAPQIKAAMDASSETAFTPYPVFAGADASAAVGKTMTFPNGYNYIIGTVSAPIYRDEIAAGLTMSARMSSLGYPISVGGNQYMTGSYGAIATVTAYTAGYPGNLDFVAFVISKTQTSNPANLLPGYGGNLDPALFAANMPLTSATAAELDNAMKNIPAALTPSTTITPDESSQAYDLAEAASAQDYADEVLALSQADPTNQELRALALEAQQAADQAALESQKEELESPQEEPFTGPALTSPARNSIDLSPFYDLQGLAASKFPFSLVASIASFFNSLAGERRAPAIIWNYRGLVNFNISLSCWDPYAANLRLLIAFFFHAGILYAITRRWSH